MTTIINKAPHACATPSLPSFGAPSEMAEKTKKIGTPTYQDKTDQLV